VEIAAREGARIVWFPTVSSENERREVLAADPDGKVPVWVRFELEMERAFTTSYTGKRSWEQVFAATRAVRPERTVWSIDLGQVFNPPVEDGLTIMADRFLAAGFDDEDVYTMAVPNTRWMALRDAADDRSSAASGA
jgi:hypothetical protein